MLIYMCKFFFLIVFVLISVAFFTLLERKILGYGHLRYGPNKNLFFGVFQPFNDAIKLFSKENIKVEFLNYNYYLFFCLLSLIINLLL